MEIKISDSKTHKLHKKLKPVVRKEGRLYYIEDIHPIDTAITWAPIITRLADDLEEYERIPFFSFSYPLLWKPSCKEVFNAIENNKDIIDNCVAFEVIQDHMDTVEGKGNYGTAIFYKKAVVDLTIEDDAIISIEGIWFDSETNNRYKTILKIPESSRLGKSIVKDYHGFNPLLYLARPNIYDRRLDLVGSIVTHKNMSITNSYPIQRL